MRGLGQDEVDNILSNEAAYSGGNPYLTSPAFLASQAAALQANCAASPNDPSCQVAEATGDITSGYNPSADTVLNLTNYCQQNAQNNAIFGDALDTANCNGQVPNPAVIQAANTIAQQSSIPSVTSSIPGAITYAPPVTNPIVATTPIQSAVTPATTIVNQPLTRVQPWPTLQLKPSNRRRHRTVRGMQRRMQRSIGLRVTGYCSWEAWRRW